MSRLINCNNDELLGELRRRMGDEPVETYSEGCEHEEGCECFESLGELDTEDLVAELKERGELGVDRANVELAYEAMLRGDYEKSQRFFRYALHPNGEGDLIAHRVKQDRLHLAPGARGQVGQSEADAERASKASHTKEKAA